MIETNFIIIALVSMGLWVIYRLFNTMKNKKINIFREVTLFVFFIYFLILLLMTIFKFGNITLVNPFNNYMYKEYGILGIINIVPIKETINTLMHSETGLRNSLRNIIGNILVFMPLGFFIPLLFDKFNNFKKIFKVGFLSSLAIELCQLFVAGNVCDIDDIIYNTIGAIAGFICYKTFEMIIEKVNLKKKLDKIRDFETNNIFKKSVKGIILVGLVMGGCYIYAFYNQTMSAELSNIKMGQKAFDCEAENIIDIKEFNDSKFYLIKDDFGVEIREIKKYIFGRYINSYMGYGYIQNGEEKYTQEWIYEDVDTNRMAPIVCGKNTTATKVIITVKDKIHEQKIKENDYFMVIYPEMISFDEDELKEIYTSEENSIVNIKLVDNKGNNIE